jgi:putative endonuclease
LLSEASGAGELCFPRCFEELRRTQSTKKAETSMHYVYLLKCSDDSIYTGCTQNIEERLIRHNRGNVHYTKDKLPLILITYIAFSDKYKAYQFEKYLKSGSGIAFRNKRLI